jgi:hypothetical protein
MAKKSDYQISSSVNEGILEIILTGEDAENTFEKMKSEIDNIIITRKVKNVLIDCRALKGHLSITKTYERVRSYPPEIYKHNFALVDLPENAEYQKFHETTAQNAGQRLKFFTDIDAARDWLKSK